MNDMAVNRGKQFEKIFQSCMERVEGVSIDRIHDQTTHFKGSTNICDFVVYRKPYQYYFECKTTHERSWPLNNLTDRQFEGMLEKSDIRGVAAGVVLWFIDYDTTMYLPIQVIAELKQSGVKSVRHDFMHPERLLLCGEKKRTFYTYYMKDFLGELQWRLNVEIYED